MEGTAVASAGEPPGGKPGEGHYKWIQDRVCTSLRVREQAFQRLLASDQRYFVHVCLGCDLQICSLRQCQTYVCLR